MKDMPYRRMNWNRTRFVFAFAVIAWLFFVENGAMAGETTHPESDAVSKECYTKIGPLLDSAEGKLTPEVRTAYLDWAEKVVRQELLQNNQSVPQECLTEVQADATLRDAIFGTVFPPDPSVLQNYAKIREMLGTGVAGKYRSLAIAVSMAKRIKGVETNLDSSDTNNFGTDYQPWFWKDESLQSVGSEPEKKLVEGIADFMKANGVAAIDLYQNVSQQQQLAKFLGLRGVDPALIAGVKQTLQFGEWLKNAMVRLGQRPATRGPKPDTMTWLRYLVSLNEERPKSVPIVNGNAMQWPLFPSSKAPWPLLMPLARPVPLEDAKYIVETFQGDHGLDRFHTYGPYRGDADAMVYELQPSRWFWDAWPDRLVHGGNCVPLSRATVDLYSCLGKPALWAGQPRHSNLISFGFVNGTWTAEIEQAFSGGPDVTFSQWYFNEDTGTMPRFGGSYTWAGAEYALGLAVQMNGGLRPYMDTRIAANIFRALPAAKKQTIGLKLLASALQASPFNPEIWYRLADETPDTMQCFNVVQSAMSHHASTANSPETWEFNTYWQMVQLFTTYSLLGRPAPEREQDMHTLYMFLRNAPGVKAEDIAAYFDKFIKQAREKPQADSLKYDRDLAQSGDAFGQLRMGQRYANGTGVLRNESQARIFFAQAAAQGDIPAAFGWENLLATIPPELISVTASSVYSPGQAEQHLLDGSGMVGAIHDNNGWATTMWQTKENPTPEPPAAHLESSPAWVRFDFTRPSVFNSILIWNLNQARWTDRGFRKTRIYGLSESGAWFPLTQPDVIELPRANGSNYEMPFAVANAAANRPVKSVIIAAAGTGGNYGGNCFGLSAVRFVEKPIPFIPSEMITVTASSVYSPGQAAQHLLDDSGMAGVMHDNNGWATTMWHSKENPTLGRPAAGLESSPAWVRFDFVRSFTFDSMRVWNLNQAGWTDRGFRKTRIYGLSESGAWFPLTQADVIELPRASGAPYVGSFTIANAAASRPIKSVIVAANATDGNYGGNCFGLSAVRFDIHQ